MKKKTRIAIAGIAIAAGVASSYASPFITMYQMRSAMTDKDADSFSSHVDFPSLRESLRGQFLTMVQSKLANSPDMKDNSFAGLGTMVAMGFANQLIDTMVTPAGVMTMMAQGAAKPAHPADAPVAPASSAAPTEATPAGSDSGAAPHEANTAPKVDYSVRYKNWSTVTATARKGTNDQVTLVFKRDGLWSWKLSGIDLPIDQFGSN
ncbi:MAG: DUF2939 domain-containing protein [Burkholderia sp.]|jgi:hypothetical protein|uniref:DUF2939 domain-containing protein n=2 Tax=Burkholderiaceae TaxID=119060 RepID=UPI00158A5C21|nr:MULTISPECIES: DUF2939 domain-containing protein [Burkholderia]MCA3782911.1 DUF2939 domain-containing protein [Burkholderia sp.]MCA3783586.1 DUF2939 domain-containing protein [Burkholderia sp.]MCA3792035.1 DUF2939 domain-containing protein [Burkholderia sp.]MCA3801320.1 DUF2939 domain-containing protein [Burkholderia sp.]MCA3811525.1 DUF2939 domain-containing protein [Burkholderia sp.]